ncbi:hypothetical protein ACH4TX_21160 [Streptomyces sp. NPDC021098]|uniref:hypothetical protein n=1 Tax=unclassified Streptomyces TaxID=2593676 RepID=UPI0037AA80B0
MGNDTAGTGAATTRGPGYALLLAAGPMGKQRLMDAAAALPQLAAVPPAALLGTPGGASVVQLVDPADPQTVLTHLRTAAAHPGPVLVYLAGQLTIDHKQRLPHLALARTTPRTARYTALPWHWLAAELAQRPPGGTTVLADLVADETAWPRLSDGRLPVDTLAGGLTLYGTIAPAPPKRQLAAPVYSRALAGLLRGGAPDGPPFALLHQQAAAEAGLGTGPALLLGAPVEGYAAYEVPGTYGVPGAYEPQGAPGAYEPPGASAPYDARIPEGGRHPGGGPTAHAPAAPSAAPHPPGPPPPAAAPAPGSAPAPEPAPPARRPEPARAPIPDPHAAIFEAAHAGRHSEAASMAAAWEQEALRSAGPRSSDAIHWLEVRADLARIAGDPARACELWLAVADARLGNGEPTGHPEVEGAVDRAHHQWQFVQEPARAHALAPMLIDLRGRVPGRRPGALEAVRRRVELLRATAQPG